MFLTCDFYLSFFFFFFPRLISAAEELQAEISPIQRIVKGVRHLDATFEVEGLVFPPTSMYR